LLAPKFRESKRRLQNVRRVGSSGNEPSSNEINESGRQLEKLGEQRPGT
jgi:hypothetical protein